MPLAEKLWEDSGVVLCLLLLSVVVVSACWAVVWVVWVVCGGLVGGDSLDSESGEGDECIEEYVVSGVGDCCAVVD